MSTPTFAPLSPPTSSSATSTHLDDVPSAEAAAVAERLLEGAIATFEQVSIHLGLRLGLYATLRDVGEATAPELAAAAGTDARYTREWLEQQAVAGYLACTRPADDPDERRFALPDGVAEALLHAPSPAYLGPLPQAALSVTRVIDELQHAYRHGGGVAFPRYGAELRDGLGALNGAIFDRSLAGWLEALPDVDARLRTASAPRILDLGCGTGRSSIALARTYPDATVFGVDLDLPSIDTAVANVARAGLEDRVRFVLGDAAAIGDDERFDLVTIFEALHDMGDPVGALRSARRLLADGGAVLIADERAADAFTPDGDPMERFLYGWSVLHCLPATRAEEHVVSSGSVLRASTVAEWAAAAGFPATTVLDIEDDMWRFYRL
jgi:SAM-dependent methyltransferase